MNKLWIKLFAVMLFSTMLSGCFTKMLLDDVDEAKQTRTITKEHEIASDNVIALGKQKSTEQIIIMGEKYWIFLDKYSSEKIQRLISGKFSQPFYVEDPIKIKVTDNTDIRTSFTLNYKPANNNEKLKLEQLKFDCYSSHCANTYDLGGIIYQKNNNLNSVQALPSKVSKHPIPLKIISIEEKQKNSSLAKVGATARAIAFAPVALVLDAVTLPVLAIYFFH